MNFGLMKIERIKSKGVHKMSHLEAKALQLYDEICVLWQNNPHDRYAKDIEQKQKELSEILEHIRKEN